MARSNCKILSEEDYAALGEFRFQLRKFLAFSEAASMKRGLTTQQHQAMLAIGAFPQKAEMTVGDLAACLLVKHHTAVEMVTRLKSEELIATSTDPDDRRRVFLRLTRKGWSKLSAISRGNLGELGGLIAILEDVSASIDHLDARQRHKQKR
jgi:DNA-binding MarR family transcriptional regulator